MLLIGLGNPGKQYARHRHNIGFMAVDMIAEKYGASAFSSRFGGHLAEAKLGTQKFYFFKPQGYMNLSGPPVAELANFYKIPLEQLFVFHDELDLPLGRLRVKKGGSNGGHNGLKSIDAHLGLDYWRIRIGIGHPGDKERVTGHVLGDFTKEEQGPVAEVLTSISQHLPLLLAQDAAGFMNKVSLTTVLGEE